MDGPEICARRIVVEGRVQGVGFRPFVYRLAQAHALRGWVCNDAGMVHVQAEGVAVELERFASELVNKAPPLARPRLVRNEIAAVEGCAQFSIAHSQSESSPRIHIPPDYFLCDDCLEELRDPSARRYRYPFINCTQCGPRYTLIRAMPYDRPNTTMAAFELCAECAAQYGDPLDRRFHAQPLACPECGPRLTFIDADGAIRGNAAALAACVAALDRGAIVAVRGIGGYHLVCDAADEAAVARLRERKHRPHKPLALMVPLAGESGLGWARRVVSLEMDQASMLVDPVRPIVLAPRAAQAPIAAGIAPGLPEVGLMLPYSPLHHLLLDDFGRPLVATSGNISGEPVLTDAAEAECRLYGIADAFLQHDRPIQRPADDPVLRKVGGRLRPVRIGRGNAPLELALPFTLAEPMLATGAFLKNTLALAWQDRVVISPHIGDLASARGQEVFRQVAADLQALYGVEARKIVCDAHPDFPNTRWARASGFPVIPVFHHHAHASAAAAERGLDETCLCFTWDGVGLGEDGTLWGGEALLGGPGAWRRVASMRPFRLPGAEKAALEPWRSALSVCWSVGVEWTPPGGAPDPILHRAWEQGINCPPTSAIGRLFDAAAALVGLVQEASFEGQGPMLLEALCRGDGEPVELPLAQDADGIWRSDWSPLVTVLADAAIAPHSRAEIFHASLAHALLAQARAARRAYGIHRVILTGGVFQNAVLVAQAEALLGAHGFAVSLPRQLPVNDAGISYGQIIEAAARAA